MRKLLILAAALGLAALASAPASAGGNGPDFVCDACKVFQRLQNLPVQIPPATTVQITKSSGRQVCVWALNPRPTALVLRNGPNNTGNALIGWAIQPSKWQQTNRGWERQICFSEAVITSRSAVTLCGDIGHSTWGRQEIKTLLTYHSLSQSDPACTGGSGWCGARGL